MKEWSLTDRKLRFFWAKYAKDVNTWAINKKGLKNKQVVKLQKG